MSPTNYAAWQKTLKGHPFTIEEAPMPVPNPRQILIKTRAVGINPADAAVQNLGLIYDESSHPLILGFDVAGEVEAVGAEMARFKPGDRICAAAFNTEMTPENHGEARGCFQLYCVADEALAAGIPENVSFSQAAVFPSCLSTAAYTLFVKDAMALDLPPAQGKASPNGKVLIVWGGSSVVGSCAIQMATLAGYEVIATSSELNFEHCRSLGASMVFDYKSPNVVEDIIAACQGKESAGAFVAYFNDDSTVSCSQIASRLGGSKVVGTVVPRTIPVPEGVAKDVRVIPNWGPSLSTTDEGIHIWQKWLPAALQDGRMQLSPSAEVAGQGLQALQGAVDTMFGRIGMFGQKASEGKSISPRKLVVEIN